MQIRDEILKHAIIGTARAPKTDRLDAAAGELGLPENGERAKKLLGLAAVEGRVRRAGHLFLKKENAAPPVFLNENWPICSPIAARMLRQILGGAFAPALAEFIGLAVFHQKSLPPASLPTILELFFEKKIDWHLLKNAVGGRGKWLAAQHPDWKNLLEKPEAAEADWFDGALPERLAFLRKHRAENPAAAREFLQKTWDEAPWEHRAQFIAALETGLSPGDEVFLEAAIFDKRKEVRWQAIRLAAKNRGSRFAGQLFDFAAQSVVFDKKSGKINAVLDKNSLNNSVLQILENTAAAKTGAADATILAEIVALVPPENWETHFGETPETLVRAFEAAELLPPVFEAVHSGFSEKWQLALLQFWATEPEKQAWASPIWAQVLAGLPPAIFDGEIKKVFSEKHFLLENNSPLFAALGRTEHFWSAEFTTAFFGHLHYWLGHQSELAWSGYYLDDFLKKTIWRAEPSVAGRLREIWQAPPRYSPISAHNMNQFWAVLDFRERMRMAFQK